MHGSQGICSFNKGRWFKNTCLIIVCIEIAVHSEGALKVACKV